MSGLVDRITAALAAYPKASEHHCGSPDCVGDARYHCWAAHVAERVTEALQLTEETNAHWGDRYTDDIPATKRRWVSGWSAVEDKP